MYIARGWFFYTATVRAKKSMYPCRSHTDIGPTVIMGDNDGEEPIPLFLVFNVLMLVDYILKV